MSRNAQVALTRRRLPGQATKFAVSAVEDLTAQFGEAPKSYAYDRGGYSADKV